MHLKAYLKTLGKPELHLFAENCETSVAQLRQIAGGFRPAAEWLAINIERESGGKVTCDELCPGVDWNYIRSTKPKTNKRVAA